MAPGRGGAPGKRVRLFTRNGHDWWGRYPLITEAALRNRIQLVRGRRRGGAARRRWRLRFQRAASRKHDAEVEFYAFDMLVSDGDDLRKLPLTMRKTNLPRLLARRVDGIHLAPFEQGEIGPDLFRHACLMGLEGLVSKPRKPRIAVAGRPLDQGQEPAASCLQSGDGSV